MKRRINPNVARELWFLGLVAFLVVFLAVMLVKSVSAQVIADPLPACDVATYSGPGYCECSFLTGEDCFEVPIHLLTPPPAPAFFNTARLHVKEFAFTDDSPFGFSTGVYKTGKPDCQPAAWPEGVTGCHLNGFLHTEALGGDPMDVATFWVNGPAVDANDAIIPGTEDDRFLIRVHLETRTCSNFVCRHEPTLIEIEATGAHWSNGLPIQTAVYNFSRNGEWGRWTPNLDFYGPTRSVYAYITPSLPVVDFDYSSVFGFSTGVRVLLDPTTVDSRQLFQDALYTPGIAFSADLGVLPRHYLPEPSGALSIAIGALALVAGVGRRRL